MRLSKQSRSKKGRVAPMSDDDGDSNGSERIQDNSQQQGQESRGVSFSTPRGRIWLILVINLSIVTTFIFMSSSRFPSLSGDGVLSDAFEQDHQHPEADPKTVDKARTPSAAHSEVTKEPLMHGTSRPGGYTKLTSTTAPDEEKQLLHQSDAAETEEEKELSPALPNDATQADAGNQQELSRDSVSKTITEESLSPTASKTADTVTRPPTVSGDTSAKSASSAPRQQSPAEITELISRMKESNGPSSETLPPEQPVEVEESSTPPTAGPQQPVEISPEIEPAAVESKAFLDNLVTWLTADSGVEVENLAACLASSGDDLVACGVNRWINQMASSDPNAADATAFRATSPQQKPVWVPVVPDTHNQLPVVYFSCPMTSDALRMHEAMTLFFVLSPAQVERGDSYAGQKFFGNSPYGQFAFHGGKPSFLANMGLVESEYMVPMSQFSLVTYRLNPGYTEIKVNGRAWGGESPAKGDADERHIRITMNDVVSLGNSKSACDTNAFQGRIAEMLIYDAVLDDAKIEAVEKYIYDKWWGDKPFPETPPPAATPSQPESAPPIINSAVEEELSTAAPVSPDTEATPLPENTPVPPETEFQQTTEKPHQAEEPPQIEADSSANVAAQDATQDATPTEEEADSTPAPKFDPLVNIFEWTAPSDSDPAKVQQWARAVKEKVEYIRNFQLGGPVLRTLIREHRDELVALREQLFG
ncbi:Ribosomal-protein-alanine acetyltransferase [Phytophthora cinnamomi]|uniref:Ribosomal-protein-alanine acetyltransferase n=1 Tax=Phytophthora cinnamomi TaxID=4785 RepID=UPI00355A44E3|nr:Ribosomal-protein-alanine acetyltransferase [Phytophthora cinnamomi]